MLSGAPVQSLYVLPTILHIAQTPSGRPAGISPTTDSETEVLHQQTDVKHHRNAKRKVSREKNWAQNARNSQAINVKLKIHPHMYMKPVFSLRNSTMHPSRYPLDAIPGGRRTQHGDGEVDTFKRSALKRFWCRPRHGSSLSGRKGRGSSRRK